MFCEIELHKPLWMWQLLTKCRKLSFKILQNEPLRTLKRFHSNCSCFMTHRYRIREMSEKIQKKHLSEEEENSNGRAEFLPVEWRSSLKLDGDTVESITPTKIRGLRSVLNASAMDILYYTSPLYRSEVRVVREITSLFALWTNFDKKGLHNLLTFLLNNSETSGAFLIFLLHFLFTLNIPFHFQITEGLQTELNRLYVLFCERHPYFEATGGKVSVLAHSLGPYFLFLCVRISNKKNSSSRP